MNLLMEDQITKCPDQRQLKTNNTNTESSTMLTGEDTLDLIKEEKPDNFDASKDVSSELYKMLTEKPAQAVDKPFELRQRIKLSEDDVKIDRKMHHHLHIIQEKQLMKQVKDQHRTRSNSLTTQKHETWHHPEVKPSLEDIENSKMQSIKQEYRPQQIEQTTPSLLQHHLVKQELYELPIDLTAAAVSNTLNANQMSIKQELTQPQYSEIPLQYPVKNEPYRLELDVKKDPDLVSDKPSLQHPIKQELNQLTRCEATNNLPAMLQRTSVKQESIQDSPNRARQMTCQQPIEPYWPQLDVKAMQKGIPDASKTLSIKKEQLQIDTNSYYKENHSSDMTTLSQQRAIKQELIHVYCPTSGVPLEQSVKKLPPWHQPEVLPQEVDLTKNPPPLQLSIKRELQHPTEPPTISLRQHTHKPSWHRPEDRNNNVFDVQLNPPALPKQDSHQKYNNYPEIPLQPEKQELFWPELHVTAGYHKNAIELMARQKAVKRELIPQQLPTAEIPLQQTFKIEPVHHESMMNQQKPLQPQVPQENALRVKQEHQVYPVKREKNSLSTDSIGSIPIQNNSYIVPPSQPMAPTVEYPRANQLYNSTQPYPIPQIPIQPFISNTQKSQQDSLRQQFLTAQLDPHILQSNILAAEYQRNIDTQARKRSRKDLAQKYGTNEIPMTLLGTSPRGSGAQNLFWHQQELLQRQRLAAAAASRLMTPTPETIQHYQHQNYRHYAMRPNAHLPDSIRQANRISQAPAKPYLPIPSQQNTKPVQNRTAKRSYQQAVGYPEQMIHNQTARLPQAPPHLQQQLSLSTPELLHQRNLPTSWRQWQPLVSPLAPNPFATGNNLPNPTRPYEDIAIMQHRQMAMLQHQFKSSKRSTRKPAPPVEGLLQMYHQQENQQRQGITQVGDQVDESGRILRAALAPGSQQPYTTHYP